MPKSKSLDDTYPLRVVSQRTGLSPDLIRAWEKRYSVVAPLRGARGARVYTREDIDHLRCLAKAVGTGRTIGDVARLDRDHLKRLAEEATAEPSDQSPSAHTAKESIIARALAAVRVFDDAALRSELGDGFAVLGPTGFIRGVGAPFLTAVGDLWHSGEISVSQEHMATAALRNLLHAAIAIRRSRSGRPSVLLATTTGEKHEGGLLMVALLLLEERIEIAYLGPEVPAHDIVATATEIGVAAVALSYTAGLEFEAVLREVRQIDRALPPTVEIWLGGMGIDAISEKLPSDRITVFKSLDALHDKATQLRQVVNSRS